MDEKIIERNLILVTKVNHFILKNPSVLDHLPSEFQLILLPEDDPELSLYNLGLLSTYTDKNRPLVMVRLDSSQVDFERTPPQLYVPLAA